MKEDFIISTLSRTDLEDLGFDTTNVSDETMESLARKLSDDYCEQMFSISLKIMAEDIFHISKH